MKKTVLRLNRRCSVTGKARGNFHQLRVSRFVFRNEADYNKVSGALANWDRFEALKKFSKLNFVLFLDFI